MRMLMHRHTMVNQWVSNTNLIQILPLNIHLPKYYLPVEMHNHDNTTTAQVDMAALGANQTGDTTGEAHSQNNGYDL